MQKSIKRMLRDFGVQVFDTPRQFNERSQCAIVIWRGKFRDEALPNPWEPYSDVFANREKRFNQTALESGVSVMTTEPEEVRHLSKMVVDCEVEPPDDEHLVRRIRQEMADRLI